MSFTADDGDAVRLRGLSLRYGDMLALDGIDVDIPSGVTVALIGPDGVGKSTLLSLIAGARRIRQGRVEVLGVDMRNRREREAICPRIAYMPQGLGKNLYPTLSVRENLDFFGRLFGHDRIERRRRIEELTERTGLRAFLDRPAGKLSGGMKQKLGLCCALIHDPDLLILDEPTTGVDPLSRSQFWGLVASIKAARPGMSVIVATAYMDEAQRFDWLLAMHAGKILASGKPADILSRTGSGNLEEAFIALLPEGARRGGQSVEMPRRDRAVTPDPAIEAEGLCMRFGDFVAVDRVSMVIPRGEIFGFLGSNGCGKSTTMKMLTGLLTPTEGQVRLFGRRLSASDLGTRRRVGYMSQSFSLYAELSVRQNLVLHARLFHVPEPEIPGRVTEIAQRFGLLEVLNALPETLPLGVRQRLSLAVAMVHKPELLILDEPTSGVDPIARDQFWRLMIELARRDQVTIFISTHFMSEAERCDRIALMHAGRVLEMDTPDGIVRKRGAETLEQAFIECLIEAAGGTKPGPASGEWENPLAHGMREPGLRKKPVRQNLARMFTYAWREALELARDPVRGALALAGSLLLMFVMGYGINMDVNDLQFAVLDHDRTTESRNYILGLDGSRYFVQRPEITDYDELDRRMRSGELALAIEIPPGFARDVGRGRAVEIGAWVDGSMPQRAETVSGYLQGMHQQWLVQEARSRTGSAPTGLASIDTRFRYNPDVRSLPAMVPAVIPLLLLMLPAMLTALAVVREKELGSIINLYVTPTTRAEFLIGKQLPYVVLAALNFLLMCVAAVTVFGVPVTGSFPVLLLAAFLYCLSSTALGLLASALTRSQISAIFFTTVGTLIPAIQFSGLINPVSSLEGGARIIGEIYPASHMFTISRGVFSKALGFADLRGEFLPLVTAIPVIMVAAVLLLKKQED